MSRTGRPRLKGLILVSSLILFSISGASTTLNFERGDVLIMEDANFSLEFMKMVELENSTEITEYSRGIALGDSYINITTNSRERARFYLWEYELEEIVDENVILRINSNATSGTNVSYTFSGIPVIGKRSELLLKMGNQTIKKFESGGKIGWSHQYGSSPTNFSLEANVSVTEVRLNITVKDRSGGPLNSSLTLLRSDTGERVLQEYTGPDGLIQRKVDTREYSIELGFSGQKLLLHDYDIDRNMSLSIQVDHLPPSAISIDDVKALNGIAAEAPSGYSSAEIDLNYSGKSADEDRIGIWKCGTWDISSRSCAGSWQKVSDTRQDRDVDTISTTVSSFSAYVAGQEEEEQKSSSGGGGSGGSGGSAEGGSGGSAGGGGGFSISGEPEVSFGEEKLDVKLRPGERLKKYFRLENSGDRSSAFTLETEGLGDLASLEQDKLVLGEGETANLTVLVNVSDNEVPGGYSGHIRANAGEKSGSLPVNVLVKSSEKDIDINVNPIQPSFTETNRIHYSLTVFNIGDQNGTLVNVTSEVINSQGETVHRSVRRNMEVTSSEVIRESPREDLKPGNYRVRVDASSGDQRAASASHFSVKKTEPAAENQNTLFGFQKTTILIFLTVFAVLVTIEMVYFLYKSQTAAEEEEKRIQNDQERTDAERTQQNDHATIDERVKEIEEEARQLESKRKRAKKNYRKGIISQEQLENYLDQINRREQELEQELDRLEEQL